MKGASKVMGIMNELNFKICIAMLITSGVISFIWNDWRYSFFFVFGGCVVYYFKGLFKETQKIKFFKKLRWH
jgi:hypothetical protein